MRTCKERGMETMKQFEVRFTIQESTEMSKKSYYDTIPRQKVITFQSTKPKKKLTMDEDETKSFAEILSYFDEKKLNLKFIMNFPVTSKPYAICGDDGKTRANQNHYLETNYNHFFQSNHSPIHLLIYPKV